MYSIEPSTLVKHTCKIDERFIMRVLLFRCITQHIIRGISSTRQHTVIAHRGREHNYSHSTLFFLSLFTHTHSPFVPFSISSLLYIFKRHEVAAIAQDRAWHCCLPIHTVPADDYHFSNASITTAATATPAAIFIDIATDNSLFDYPIASLVT